MAGERLLIVSNRLPVTASIGAGVVRLAPASGGLATGLGAHHAKSGGLWIGWPGDLPGDVAEARPQLTARLRERGIVPVYLSQDNVERYYHGFANRVLWPLFHYLIDRVPVHATGWDAYRQVNEAFADAVVREYRDGDRIWIHDYQLMLLPTLLRERLPSAQIGFFLHIPFPSSEVFRILPWRGEILAGLLGADLVGFHTYAYLRHFVAALLHVAGVESDIDRIRVGDRDVQVGVFPMGVAAAAFAELAHSPEVVAQRRDIRAQAGDRRIVLGVDRLDYTKGIPRRLRAIERLLERQPELRDGLRYIQVAVPSRGAVESYQRFKRQVEESVGRINGAAGTLSSVPVHYVNRSVSPVELVALYGAADVMLVTPLRDGMNLVAKEFVASRVDEDGVLVLSEFAGAAAELDGAMTVNAYDVDAVASAVAAAVSMPAAERRVRMQRLRRRVLAHDVHTWAADFLDRLDTAGGGTASGARAITEGSIDRILGETRSAPALRLLLDYDGTLVPIVRAPELAAPDDEIRELLGALAAGPRIGVEIVSGRSRDTLDAWLGALPIGLWAEHGFWHRAAPGEPWIPESAIPTAWMARVDDILERFAADTPGSQVERKSASIAWHYRRADPEFGPRQAHELRMLLGDVLSNQPFEVIEGKKVIEVRLRGVNKGLIARRAAEPAGEHDALAVAIGDDRTDEDLFRALPSSSVTIAVGGQLAAARFCLADYRDVRRLLSALLAQSAAAAARVGR